jgi:hypothetical protein
MSRTAQEEQELRGVRSLFMILILTSGAVYSIHGHAFPPHGNPLVYSLAISWLVSITLAVVSSAIFFPGEFKAVLPGPLGETRQDL